MKILAVYLHCLSLYSIYYFLLPNVQSQKIGGLRSRMQSEIRRNQIQKSIPSLTRTDDRLFNQMSHNAPYPQGEPGEPSSRLTSKFLISFGMAFFRFSANVESLIAIVASPKS